MPLNFVNGLFKLISMAARSKAWVCGRSLAGGFESRRGHECLSVVSVVCCQVERSLRRSHHSCRGVLPSVVCLTDCDREASIMRRP
jgi:hypothetical protein